MQAWSTSRKICRRMIFWSRGKSRDRLKIYNKERLMMKPNKYLCFCFQLLAVFVWSCSFSKPCSPIHCWYTREQSFELRKSLSALKIFLFLTHFSVSDYSQMELTYVLLAHTKMYFNVIKCRYSNNLSKYWTKQTQKRRHDCSFNVYKKKLFENQANINYDFYTIKSIDLWILSFISICEAL